MTAERTRVRTAPSPGGAGCDVISGVRRRGFWRGRHTVVRLMAAGLILGAVAAGCSSRPAAPRSSVASCTAFGVWAVKRHVTVTALPPACQGLTRAQFSDAVGSAVRTAAVGGGGKLGQRERLAAASGYLRYLVAKVAAPHGQPSAVVPASPRIGRTALGLAALCTWLITIGLGLRMLARWITRGRRGHVLSARRWRRAGRNLSHLGLAVASLLVWVAYLATGVTGLAWAACALLAVVTGLGMTLVFLPAGASPAGRAEERAPQAPATAEPGPVRRRNQVVFVVGAHVVFATTTLLLAVLAAVGIS